MATIPLHVQKKLHKYRKNALKSDDIPIVVKNTKHIRQRITKIFLYSLKISIDFYTIKVSVSRNRNRLASYVD